MIVVTGATGHLGKAIVENLLRRLPAGRIVASVRDAQNAGDLIKQGIEVRTGDFTHASGSKAAFRGAEQVPLNSPFRTPSPPADDSYRDACSRTALSASPQYTPAWIYWPEAHRQLFGEQPREADLP